MGKSGDPYVQEMHKIYARQPRELACRPATTVKRHVLQSWRVKHNQPIRSPQRPQDLIMCVFFFIECILIVRVEYHWYKTLEF
jgi:hypothetical protein